MSIRVSLRLPPEVYEWLKMIAHFEKRSLNGQMLHIIFEYAREHELTNSLINQKIAGIVEESLTDIGRDQ